MGAKGHSKVELVLMGSVTEKVVRETESIPVWVVK
jgi:nucleotide-binding universal stress UspA family protein